MNPENIWFRNENTIYQIRLYDAEKNVMQKASIFFLDSGFHLVQRIDAQRISWTNPGWLAEDGLIISFRDGNKDQQWFERKQLDLKITPSDFKAGEAIPRYLSWTELHRYVEKIEGEGFSSTPYRVDLHLRLASPLATLILTLLGTLIALRQGLHEGIGSRRRRFALYSFRFHRHIKRRKLARLCRLSAAFPGGMGRKRDFCCAILLFLDQRRHRSVT